MRADHPAFPYVIPFVGFIALLAVQSFLPTPSWVRFVVTIALILAFSRRPLSQGGLVKPAASILIGLAVFAIWIGPDVLFPGYRNLLIFNNALFGKALSTMTLAQKTNPLSLIFRVLVSIVSIPILEELFWRGWLMRWIIDHHFDRIPLGAYRAMSFWVVAVLFASEHGSYWEVGLIAGVIYNWWMIKTRSLWDCILAHSVTNGLLAWWVIAHHQWQYWL